MSSRTASCFCGQLQIQVEGEPQFVGICHCLACQRRTGSVFATLASFPLHTRSPVLPPSTSAPETRAPSSDSTSVPSAEQPSSTLKRARRTPWALLWVPLETRSSRLRSTRSTTVADTLGFNCLPVPMHSRKTPLETSFAWAQPGRSTRTLAGGLSAEPVGLV